MPGIDPRRQIVATVQEVLPRLGLAYVTDEHECSWGITRNMCGAALDKLATGSQVRLTIEDHDGFALASAWAPFDW